MESEAESMTFKDTRYFRTKWGGGGGVDMFIAFWVGEFFFFFFLCCGINVGENRDKKSLYLE